MTEEEHVEEQIIEDAVSEQSVDEASGEQQDQKMVPLSAMLATRKKLQEAQAKASKADAKAELLYQELMRQKESVSQEPEDPTALVEKQTLKDATMATKREIMETLFQDMNPEAVQKIDLFLDPILKKKPWLAASVDSALNRYARAWEIVQDYQHLVEEKPLNRKSGPSPSDAKKMVENANKPKSPADVGKSAQPAGMDYLKSIQGTKEFREYRKKLLHG